MSQKTDGALGLLEKALAVDLHGDVRRFFATRLLAATLSAARGIPILPSGRYLPDDDEAIRDKVDVAGPMGNAGFLTGFTQAVSAAANAASEPVDRRHTAESLKDFAAIAQIDIS